MLFIISCLIIMNVLLIGVVYKTLNHVLRHFLPLKEDMVIIGDEGVQGAEVPDNAEHDYEYESARNAEMDERVARLKEELASKQPIEWRTGYDAEVTHPGVENLPHSIIPETYSNTRKEEYAE